MAFFTNLTYPYQLNDYASNSWLDNFALNIPSVVSQQLTGPPNQSCLQVS